MPQNFEDQYNDEERPSVVTAACVILFVMAALGILGAIATFALSSEAGDKEGFVQVLATLILILSVLYAVLAALVLKGSNGARIAVIVVMAVGIVLEFFNFSASSVVSIGLALLVIGLLAWNRDAKRWFLSR